MICGKKIRKADILETFQKLQSALLCWSIYYLVLPSMQCRILSFTSILSGVASGAVLSNACKNVSISLIKI